MSANAHKAKVRIDKLRKVAEGGLCRKNNSLDNKYTPSSQFVILERVKEKLGTGNYDLFFNNCEHFVTHCRYGIPESQQMEEVGDGILLATALIAAGVGTSALLCGLKNLFS
ncbi:unnamed protein product [Enterobius vermicularis]|uniref:LRAT domain-containing protein n=1 Tax=Enterobius vermicularis TaxID=51028 RepID=A0A0N4VQI9_ENTVE|nr:unnamed protein product [Enterobius vermicularis]